MDTPSDRLDELCWCYLDRGLTPDEEAELTELLGDAECQQRWRYLMTLEGKLQEELEMVEIPVPGRTGRIVGDIIKFMTPLALAAGFVFALFHFGLLGGKVIEGDVIAEVVAVTGEVFREGGEGGEKSTLETGDSVSPGDRVTTPEAGEVKLAYRDGTALTLREAGGLKFPAAAEGSLPGKTLVLDGGVLKAFASRQSERTPMLLTTPHAECTVIGTKFTLMAGSGFTRLDVAEGRISFKDLKTGKVIVVSAGMCATADGENDPVEAKSLGREFSPKYEGMLFKEVAEIYEKTGLFLSETREGKTMRRWSPAEFMKAASGGTVNVKTGTAGKGRNASEACLISGGKGSFEFPLFKTAPIAFTVEFGYALVSGRKGGGTEIGIRGCDEFLPKDVPGPAEFFDKGMIQLMPGRWYNVKISCLLVGQMKDGRPVYEQTMVLDGKHRNSHSLGAGPCNLFGITLKGADCCIRNFRVREILMDRNMAADYFGNPSDG